MLATRAREGEKLAGMILERVERMRVLVAEAGPKLPQALAAVQGLQRIWRRDHPGLRAQVYLRQLIQVVERIDRRTMVMRLNNLSSFSSDRDIAGCFGDTILTVQAPVTKIAFFNALLATHPLKGEGEYLVIGGEYRASASYF